jgi:putative membrane protein insertion efficiency factor
MRHKGLKLLMLIVLPLMTLPFPAAGEDNACSRFSDGASGTGVAEDGFVPAAVDLFRRHISPIDGDRCPMVPSCSQYSLEALNKHGLVMGWIMTCDRLLRCGRDELAIAPRIIVDGGWRCYDSVEDNDFWRARQ